MTDTSQKLGLYCRQDSNILEGKKHKKFVVRKLKRLVLRDKHIQKSSFFFLLVTLKPHKFLTFLVRPHLSIARGNIKASIFCFLIKPGSQTIEHIQRSAARFVTGD